MKVKFKDGTVKTCSAPTEQKIFKNVRDDAGNTVSTGYGWLSIFKISGCMTSDEADHILTTENIGKLEFLAENIETGELVKLFEINGYSKISATTIRHAEDETESYTEIQLSKGV